MVAMSTEVAAPAAFTEPAAFAEPAALVAPVAGARHRPLRGLTAIHFATDLGVAALATPLAAADIIVDLLLVLAWAAAVSGPRAASPLDEDRWGLRRVSRAAMLLGLLCWVTGALLAPQHDTVHLISFLAATAAGSLLARVLVAGVRDGRPLRTLVVGAQTEAAEVAATLARRAAGRRGDSLRPVGCCAPERLESVLLGTAPDVVLAVPSAGYRGREIQRTSWLLERHDVPLLVHTGLADVAPQRSRVLRTGPDSVLGLACAPRTGIAGRTKAWWERGAAAALLLSLLPLLLVVAIWIRLDSSGPALFRQTRIGRNDRPFTMLKFRTMVVDAPDRVAELREQDEGCGVLFKVRHDPRVTRLGRVLRRYSIDELPQLINVLRGDMALVGPRPALPEEVAAYDHDPRRRLEVRPGLTGLWQVSGRSDLSWEETVRLDLDYVDNWSLGRDLIILARTVRAVLAHDGAY